MATTKMKISTTMGQDFETKVNCSHPFVIDQPKAAGGKDAGPNPLEIFLSSLGACICAIGRIIANQEKIQLNGMEVNVEGEIDKDFLLGKTTDGRSGYTDIKAFVTVDADMTNDEKQQFIERIASRCPVADNIKHATKLAPVLSDN